MSTPVVVVGRVWIDYPRDPAPGWAWSIYDAATGAQITDAVGMQISVQAGSRTIVDIQRMNVAGTDRYELVAKPAPAPVIVSNPTPSNHPTSGGGGGFMDSAVFKALTRHAVRGAVRDAVQKLVPAARCAECSGSGFYTSPISGKRSPCSRGCKQP
jgi:hypothetical protein